MKMLKPRLAATIPARVKSISQTTRISGSRRVKIRQDHFRLKPFCVYCEQKGFLTLAEELDHITPLWAGGRDIPENRQGLCKPCHAAKTAEEAGVRAACSFHIG